jgi:hypothetical protein
MGNIVAASARPGQPARKPLVDRYRRGPPVLVAGDKSPVRPVATPPPAPRRGKPRERLWRASPGRALLRLVTARPRESDPEGTPAAGR